MEKRELICIGCPLGCPLTVTMEGEQITVAGNLCKEGSYQSDPCGDLLGSCKEWRDCHGFRKDKE